jgi:hypothetical protein
VALGVTPNQRAVVVGFHGREAGAYTTDVVGETVVGWRHAADLCLTRAPLFGTIVPVDYGPLLAPDPVRDGWLDVEAFVHLVLFGVQAKFRGGELLDLVAGFALFDPSGDDQPGPLRVPLDGLSQDVRHSIPELDRLLASMPLAPASAARPLWADASGDDAVRLGLAVVRPDGREMVIEVVRIDGALAVLDERTRLARPWLR